MYLFSQTYTEFVNMYRTRQEMGGYRYTEFAQFAFDAVWTLALALNSSLTKVIPNLH